MKYGTRRNESVEPPSSHGLDGGIIAATAILAGLGFVMIYSTTAPLSPGSAIPSHWVRHCFMLALGIGCAWAVARVPLALWHRWALPLWIVSILLLIVTAFAGVRVNGAQRWLDIPGIGMRFQPAELTKWATLMVVAAFLAGKPGREVRHPRVTLATFGFALVPASLLLLQPDMGNAAILILLVGLLLFVAGAPLRLFTIPGALGALGLAAYVQAKPYALDRWLGFRDPWATAETQGFQLVQSFVAFGRGGFFGVGIGDGRQKLFYLPEAHTDFMLAAVGEELGFVGVLVVLGGFAAFAVAGLRIAGRAQDRFSLLVAFAMTALIALPAGANAAVVTGLLPPKGLPLPFLSYGGSATLVSFICVGMLLRLARFESAPAKAGVGGAELLQRWRR